MKELSQLTCLVVDRGLFCENAIRLAKDVRRVLYYVPSEDAWPKMNPAIIGYGIEGLEVVEDLFGDHFEYVDCFIFFDCGFGPTQTYLESIGKTVWGARDADAIELDRPYCKEVMADLGLPVGKFKVIKGVKALREYLKTHEDVYVKVSEYRATCESFHSPDYKTIEPLLDKIEFTLGPLKTIMEFDVEDALPDKVELGTDNYCIDGQLPDEGLIGIEIKDAGYGGVWLPRSSFPKPMQDVDIALASHLEQYSCRGFFSTEVRVGEDQVPFLIDPTIRCPNPGSGAFMQIVENYSEIIWRGANGDLVQPKPLAKYVVQLMMKSDWADQEGWQPINFDEKDRDWIKIANPCKIDGVYYSVPLTHGLREVGSVVGMGDTLQDAIKACQKVAEGVSGYNLKLDSSALDKASEAFTEAASMGINLVD